MPAGEPVERLPGSTRNADHGYLPVDEAEPSSAPPKRARMPEVGPPPEYRGGFMVGLTLGVGLGASNGFPDDDDVRGLASVYRESGIGPAVASSAYFGGAITEYFSVGVGTMASHTSASGVGGPGYGMLMHVDAFPFFGFGSAFRDLGVMLELGAGYAHASDERGALVIDGDVTSYVAGGVFWEGLEVWELRMGPSLGVHHMFSSGIRRPLALIGWRTSLYTLP